MRSRPELPAQRLMSAPDPRRQDPESRLPETGCEDTERDSDAVGVDVRDCDGVGPAGDVGSGCPFPEGSFERRVVR